MSTFPNSTSCSPTTPPTSMTAHTTSPHRHLPHGRPPCAGTTTTQLGGWPKCGRSEQTRSPVAVATYWLPFCRSRVVWLSRITPDRVIDPLSAGHESGGTEFLLHGPLSEEAARAGHNADEGT